MRNLSIIFFFNFLRKLSIIIIGVFVHARQPTPRQDGALGQLPRHEGADRRPGGPNGRLVGAATESERGPSSTGEQQGVFGIGVGLHQALPDERPQGVVGRAQRDPQVIGQLALAQARVCLHGAQHDPARLLGPRLQGSNLYFIGLMGSGKSAVGDIVARSEFCVVPLWMQTRRGWILGVR